MERVGNSNDITITIEDDGNYLMAGVQSYSVKCDIDYEKIGAMGEAHPTDYYVRGRLYTITFKRVCLFNTKLFDGRTVFDKYHWKDFETVVSYNGVGGGKGAVHRFRNCYRVEAEQSVDIDGNPMYETVTILSHNCGYEADDLEYYRAKKMIYGGFTFPYNPSNSEYSIDKKYIEHKFPGLSKNDIEDLGTNCSVITCEGIFYGSEGTKAWSALLKEYKKKGARKTYHPFWHDVKKSLMIDLKGSIDEGKKMIRYSFTLLKYDPPALKKGKSKSKSKSTSSKKSSKSGNKKKTGKVKSKNELKVGSLVYLTGVCCYTSTGGKPHSKKFTHKKMTVTKIHSNGSHPIHLGSVGWVKVSDLSWS